MDYGGIYINRDLTNPRGYIGTLLLYRDNKSYIHSFSKVIGVRYRVHKSEATMRTDKPWAFKAGPSVLVEWGEE